MLPRPPLFPSAVLSVSMGSSSTRMVGMVTFKAGEFRPTSAFLRFRWGLTGWVGDGVSRGGLVWYWDTDSLIVTGDALFPDGLGDLRSVWWPSFVSLLGSSIGSLVGGVRDFADVKTSASLSDVRADFNTGELL